MSKLEVKILPVEEIVKTAGSDRLFSIRILGWWLITSGIQNEDGSIVPRYEVGTPVIYLPIDSVLSMRLENFLFPPDSKIKLTNSRIKTLKLRGAVSQGMAVAIDDELLALYPKLKGKKIGDDVTDILEVTKFEPPVSSLPTDMRIKAVKMENPFFHKYTDIDHLKKYNDIIPEGEPVVFTEKIHGSSWRGGLLPKTANTWYKKVLKFFGLLRGFEKALGSRNVQKHLQPKSKRNGWYSTDIWSRVEAKYDLLNKLDPNMTLYGEVYGPGVQKGYHYGMKDGELGFAAFDIMIDGRYVDHEEFSAICKERDIPTVPVLYKGPFNKDLLDKFVAGDSILEPTQKVREGIVVKPLKEQNHPNVGRMIFKHINPKYLLKDDLTEWK